MTERRIESPAFTLRDARRDEADAISALIQRSNAEYEPNYTPDGWQRYFTMLAD